MKSLYRSGSTKSLAGDLYVTCSKSSAGDNGTEQADNYPLFYVNGRGGVEESSSLRGGFMHQLLRG